MDSVTINNNSREKNIYLFAKMYIPINLNMTIGVY